jgi:von Willebrand factor type A domain
MSDWDDDEEDITDAEEEGEYAILRCGQLRFTSNSAVVLPGSYRVYAEALRLAKDRFKDRTLLLLSHTDAEGSHAFNDELSQLRALNSLNVLMGDRLESWVTTCQDRHKALDVWKILDWCAMAAWRCKPKGDAPADSVTALTPDLKTAMAAFREEFKYHLHNATTRDLSPARIEPLAAAIGAEPPDWFWRAVYELFTARIRTDLHLSKDDFESLRSGLQLLPEEPARGCGERYPLEDKQKSEVNRRTEFLFFPADAHVPIENLARLYDEQRYTADKLDCPGEPDPTIEIVPPEGDFLIALDMSGSMAAVDGTGQSRLERVVAALKAVLDARVGTGSMCAFTFDSGPKWLGPGTRAGWYPCNAANVNALKTALDGLAPGGGTATKAMMDSIHNFSSQHRRDPYEIVFLSDGLPGDIQPTGLNRAATDFKNKGRQSPRYTVHSYGFSLVDGDRLSRFMRAMASSPSSKYWHPIPIVPRAEDG